MVPATVFDIQRFATKDGPGIRTLVFLKGCPLHCQWCANPESQLASPQVLYDPVKCKGCGRCIRACPSGAISPHPDFGMYTDPERCTSCGACVEACFFSARKISGKSYTPSKLVTLLEKDLPYFRQSGGGVTFSGGEPLVYPEFLRQVLSLCTEKGIDVAIETCGQVPWESFEAVLPTGKGSPGVSLVFFDFKHIDPELHRQYTGMDNRLILQNLRKLSGVFSNLVVRIPVIPGVNFELHTMQRMFGWLLELPAAPRVELLPYHRLGTSKYKGLGRDYTLKSLPALTPGDLETFEQLAREMGLMARVGAV
ncbi:MAG TPA: glycyl-radical enzyme activating protein [Thermotogota bacterium]|nr:glycyl-radical enzyme activating protein [Thermotogota bacterium]HRW92942.1 glycyl-radical enzyme activating protein [Thermotogota bacterium]